MSGSIETKGATQGTSSATTKEVQGTLVRGPDGKLYFLPDSKLSAFQVPDKGVSKMQGKITGDSVATRTAIPAEWMNLGFCIVHHE